jgi:O-antigen ligase
MMEDEKSPTVTSFLAVFTIILALATSLWRLWNWPIFVAVISGKISPVIPQIQAADKTISLFGLNGQMLLHGIISAGAVTLILVRRFQVRDRRFWLALLPGILLMALAALSLSWSVVPQQTSNRILPFVALTCAGVILGLTSRENEILTALEIFSIGVIVACFFALWRYPTNATMTAQGAFAWRGIFLHKNYLGLAMTVANLIFLVRLFEFRRQHWILWLARLGLYALTLFMLLKSNAKASLVALIAATLLLALGFATLRWGHRLNKRHWILVTCAGVAGMVLLWLARQPILDILGRSSALTGRIPLWSVLVPYIAARPLLGYGFGDAFWNKYQGTIDIGGTWHPPHAHNAFVDFALALGLLGLALVLILLVEIFVLDLRHFLRVRLTEAMWPLLLLALSVLISMAESLLASQAYFLWTLLLLSFGLTLRGELAAAGASR